MATLHPSLREALVSAARAAPGVRHVGVSNSYGLPVFGVCASGHEASASFSADAAVTFGVCAEALERLCAGKLAATVTAGAGETLVQRALFPLVLTLVLEPGADVDAALHALPALAAVLEPVRAAAEAQTAGAVGGGGGVE